MRQSMRHWVEFQVLKTTAAKIGAVFVLQKDLSKIGLRLLEL